MHARLIRIGNSQGVRLPRAVIEQAGLTEDLELEVVGDAIVIRSGYVVRQGWSEAAAECREAGEDRLGEWDTLAGDGSASWE